ncbi:uncharacterized protein PITG_23138 [Phytophthora infestans T30-4]|uniref:Secreted RxLR effector peptide protein n=1 Tax=Phytophthora infestans (strain T30-4) TaxID=403677 RepID=D0NZB1_PHYIT|nr:uncharacterized protein PITG_23138 [Phytophthora infestans T30-4]EEY68920.1 hypothetical protein PITG_23138 [Phytophthora infestans T30-4]|eukprot:XP_002997306.1 hypothetical protein PITG_23138 [Phytophthora infestans T30-4]
MRSIFYFALAFAALTRSNASAAFLNPDEIHLLSDTFIKRSLRSTNKLFKRPAEKDMSKLIAAAKIAMLEKKMAKLSFVGKEAAK